MTAASDQFVCDELGFVKRADVCLVSLSLEDVQAVTDSRLTLEQFRRVVDELQEELNEGFLGRVRDAVNVVLAEHPDTLEDSE